VLRVAVDLHRLEISVKDRLRLATFIAFAFDKARRERPDTVTAISNASGNDKGSPYTMGDGTLPISC
jgi:hypothetical protein